MTQEWALNACTKVSHAARVSSWCSMITGRNMGLMFESMLTIMHDPEFYGTTVQMNTQHPILKTVNLLLDDKERAKILNSSESNLRSSVEHASSDGVWDKTAFNTK
jgi:hypothetical protein